MKNSQTPSFIKDQYFILNKKNVVSSLSAIEKIVKQDHSNHLKKYGSLKIRLKDQ